MKLLLLALFLACITGVTAFGNLHPILNQSKCRIGNMKTTTTTTTTATYSYNPPSIPQYQLEEIRVRFKQRLHGDGDDDDDNGVQTSIQRADLGSLRVHSIKEDFSLDILTQFYNELMIPQFPLQDELDSLEDWIFCLDPQKIAAYDEDGKRGPVMDVLILLCQVIGEDGKECSSKHIILGGVAFEYYQDAKVGLVSYIVVDDVFQKNGIMKRLHPLAVNALQNLHTYSHVQRNGCIPEQSIRAILAETNTINAGDASLEEIRDRHVCLYKLGYRMLEFPYVQPPLGTNQDSFDNLMLLVYQGAYAGEGKDRSIDDSIPSDIPYSYVVDFFESVFGYSDVDAGENEEFQDHWYYKLATWFTKEYSTCMVKPLPWDDVTDYYRNEHDKTCETTHNHFDDREKEMTVAVVGAGAAGLAAAIELAKTIQIPLYIQLIEANSFVGGRIRTVLTNEDDAQYVSPELTNACKAFSPWPVPIGAEFIHGVGSVINDVIEETDVFVEETFDLCSSEEYPMQSSFTKRQLTKSLDNEKRLQGHVKVFGEGRCFDLKHPHSGLETGEECSRFAELISKANSIWDHLYDLGEDVVANPTKLPPSDQPLSSFIEDLMQDDDDNDVKTVKSIMDAVYAKTAGSSVEHFSVNEGAREEISWDYSECNWRSKNCFSEIVMHYLDRIDEINLQFRKGQSKVRIELMTSTPITAVSTSDTGNSSNIVLTTQHENNIHCDKVIIAVPLSILKAEKMSFNGYLSLTEEKRLAIDSTNMFSGMKAHMLLRKGIDIDESSLLEDTEIFFCPSEIFVQVWVRRDETSVFITGFVVADGRDLLVSRTEKGEKTEQIFLNQIQRMTSQQGSIFRHSIPTCSAFMLHDWSDDEFTMGIYSSPSVGAGWKPRKDDNASTTMRHDLRMPIHDKVFFAGEHTNVKTCASVQAAIESGVLAARDVASSVCTHTRERNLSNITGISHPPRRYHEPEKERIINDNV